MFAHVFHGIRDTEVMCRKGTIGVHSVEVFDGEKWWRSLISPRVTTPWRIAVTCAAAVHYVREKMQ